MPHLPRSIANSCTLGLALFVAGVGVVGCDATGPVSEPPIVIVPAADTVTEMATDSATLARVADLLSDYLLMTVDYNFGHSQSAYWSMSATPGALSWFGPETHYLDECRPVVTGVDDAGRWIDADHDNFADDYSITFPLDCPVKFDLPWSSEAATVTGRLRMHQSDVGAPGYRLTVDHLTFTSRNDSTNDFYRSVENAEESITGHPGYSDYAFDLRTESYRNEGDTATPSGWLDLHTRSRVTTEIAKTGTPYGTVLAASLTSTGSLEWLSEYADGTYPARARVTYQSETPLHYNESSCIYPFDAGTMRVIANDDPRVGALVTIGECQAVSIVPFDSTKVHRGRRR